MEENRYSYRKKGPLILMCLALAITVIAGLATAARPPEIQEEETVYAVREAQYPVTPQRPASAETEEEKEDYALWEADRAARSELAAGCAEALAPFSRRSAQLFLTAEEGKNQVYSPLSLYMTLSALSETTGGETRRQILDLLGAASIDSLREQAQAIWNACCYDDGMARCVLSTSIWLDDGISFVPSTLDTLAGTYFASSFRGEMGSEAYDEILREWLAGQTGGYLRQETAGESFRDDTKAALMSVVSYRSAWVSAFSESDTRTGTFASPGGETSCLFLHQTLSGSYWREDGFTAAFLPLDDGGKMWFLLPDEGVSPEELTADGRALDFLLSASESEEDGAREGRGEGTAASITFSVPKFDVGARISMEDGLKRLGVVNAFSPELSNFAPLTDDAELYVGSVRQAVRVAVNEEGCSGASYTAVEMTDTGGALPEEEFGMTLDRPFLFAVCTAEELPVFLGIVCEP